MGNVIKNVRGTSDEHASYIGEKGVISLVTNEVFEPTGEIRVHDGKTPGGINPIDAGIAAVSSVTSDMFVGMIASFGMETPPDGWHICNGGEYSLASYPELYAVIGTTWGDLTDGLGGSGDTHFRVPDLRGEFLRGFDNGLGSDPDAAGRTGGDAVGSSQTDEIKSHSHTISPTAATAGNGSGGRNHGGDGSYHGHISATQTHGGNETRPRNKYVQFCIKY